MISEIKLNPARKPLVLVIMGSIRHGRYCPLIAQWAIGIAASCSDPVYELVDLADWHLPMDDEPGVPALGAYIQQHTRDWSEKINGADAFIFVTPQYNWGYPAALKNAIDHLYKEWKDKPAVIVTYGGHGGNKCAAQLRQVLDGVHILAVPTMPGITLKREMIEGGPVDPEADFTNEEADQIRKAIKELIEELSARY